MAKIFNFSIFLLFAFLFTACSFVGNEKTSSVSFCIGEGVYSKLSASRTTDENSVEERYLRITLKGDYTDEKTMPLHYNTIRAIMTFGDIPEGAVIWAYAVIYEIFDGEEYYILEGKSEKVTIKEGDNAVTLSMTSFGDVHTNYIGTKVKPTAVGDIVFTDGSAIAYSDMTSDRAGSAIAVIFYAGGTDGLGSRILGVGLTTDNNTYRWAVEGADTTNAIANTDAYDGSVNWGKLYDKHADAKTTPSNYPAFQYANNYSATGFTSGWYVPARYELKELRTNVEVVNNAIDLIAESRTDVSIIMTSENGSSYDYWSSTEYNSGYAYKVEFSATTSSESEYASKSEMRLVRPIHAF